jgi:hypothetical protein
MPNDLPPDVAARAHRATDPLHSMIYFAPEPEEEYAAVGLQPGRMGYFASRSAPMGAVSAGVTIATFYNFNPSLVAHFIPAAWALAQPEAILTARLAGADRALRRLLGDEVVASPELAEAAALGREACTALSAEARPLYAGHAELPWPDAPHLVLWHAATVLREYRGDGHVAALLEAELSGLEAIYTHTLTGRGFTPDAAKKLRGWSDEQWADAANGLRDKGLVDDAGLTAAGTALRDQVEATTDRLDQAAWLHLGPERTQRLTDLGKGLTRVIVGNGAFSAPGVFAGSR